MMTSSTLNKLKSVKLLEAGLGTLPVPISYLHLFSFFPYRYPRQLQVHIKLKNPSSLSQSYQLPLTICMPPISHH